MAQDILKQVQPDGTLKVANRAMSEKEYVIAKIMGRLHIHENASGESFVFLNEVANTLDVSEDTLRKDFDSKYILYYDLIHPARVDTRTLQNYLAFHFHPVQLVDKTLFQGDICFVADTPYIYVDPLYVSYDYAWLDLHVDKDFMMEKMLTTTEVSNILRTSTKVVYRLLKSSQMSYFRIGSRYRIPAECVAIYYSTVSI